MNVPEMDEAELRAQTTAMYRHGGVENVLDCLIAMQRCQNVILAKLNEILEEEIDNAGNR